MVVMTIVNRLLLVLVATCCAAGCAPSGPVRPAPQPAPPRTVEEPPRDAVASSGPAVLALLEQADAELQAGAPGRAIAKLENALRIAPRNPLVWQRLAQANLQDGRAGQAEALALRSISLARGNPELALESWRIVAQARRERGDRAGAQSAEEKVTEMEERLGR